MKLYTKAGDAGETALFGGRRVSKADARVEAYGSVDELNSVLGLVAALGFSRPLLEVVQSQLFTIGAELASDPQKSNQAHIPMLGTEAILALESEIDWSEEQLAPLKNFVLPGGCEVAARLHVARTVCRRAERRIVALAAIDSVRPEVVRFLNRLSDLLFSWARWSNHCENIPDVPWQP